MPVGAAGRLELDFLEGCSSCVSRRSDTLYIRSTFAWCPCMHGKILTISSTRRTRFCHLYTKASYYTGTRVSVFSILVLVHSLVIEK